MKKAYGLLICLMVVLLLAGCGTSPGTSTTSGTVNKNAGISVNFEGFWEFEEGDIMYVKGATFVLLSQGGEPDTDGIFSISTTRPRFFWEVMRGDQSGFATFDYIVNSETEILVSSTDAQWANGIWRKRDDISFDSDHPLTGYWQLRWRDSARGETGVQILNILPFGWGFRYTCDDNYYLISRCPIEYDDGNPFEFREIETSGTREISMTMRTKFFYELDGDDLIVSIDTNRSRFGGITRSGINNPSAPIRFTKR